MEQKGIRDGFGNAIAKLGEMNQKIVVLAAGVGDSTQAFKFKEKFSERYIEAGIAEQNMVGMAAGLALGGKIPFATSFATFLPGRCFDQIRQSVCYANLNVKLVATHAGLTVGQDGATHQMMEDIALMRSLPNMTVIAPCDAVEAEKAVLAAAEIMGPVFIRLGRDKQPVISQDKNFEIGRSVLMRNGHDVTLIATGIMVYYALLAAEELEKEGISARVINMHTVKPIDKGAIVKAAKETRGIVTAEEHQVYGGLGSAVAEVLSQEHPAKLRIIGMPDKFGESGKPDELLKKYGLTEKEIAEAARNILK